MFKNTINSKQQGDVGLGAAIACYTRMGWTVSIPLNDSQPYDLIVDNGNKLCRVQVKTTKHKPNNRRHYEVALRTCGGNQSFHTVKHFDHSLVEYLFVLTQIGQCYNIPTTDFDNKTAILLAEKYDKYRVDMQIGNASSL